MCSLEFLFGFGVFPNLQCALFSCFKCVADVEKAVLESLEKQYTDVLSPLKEYSAFRKYVKKIAKGSVCPYVVSTEVCMVLPLYNYDSTIFTFFFLFLFYLLTKNSSPVPPF